MARALLGALLVAACGRGAEPPPSFRDAAVPIASSLRAGDAGGPWVVAAAFPGGPVRPGDRVGVGASAWTLDERAVPVRPEGPGRFAAEGLPDLWLLWIDEGGRTAVVGTPDGRLGWIMDRPGEASPDRLQAAREVLDFNGYDLSGLRGR